MFSYDLVALRLSGRYAVRWQVGEVAQVVYCGFHENIVDCKWVYKIKTKGDGSLHCYKAGLVPKGFNQSVSHQRSTTSYDKAVTAILSYNNSGPMTMKRTFFFLLSPYAFLSTT